MSETDRWSTITLRLPPGPIERAALAAATDALESLGAIMAESPDVGGVELRDSGTFGHVERPELVLYTTPEAASGLRAQAESIARGLGLELRVALEQHEGDDWRDVWKQYYRPLVFGDNALLVRPSWIERRPDDPELEILIDPGRAFGTGLHETTQLCLEQLTAAWRDGLRPARVLDLGCGSGILSLAAARLFPHASIVAMDIDPEATATTSENAELNGLTTRLDVRTGTVDELEEGHWDLVLANIRPEVLVPGAAEIARRSGRDLVLSGILDEELVRVEEAYVALGDWRTVERRTQHDWRSLHLRRVNP